MMADMRDVAGLGSLAAFTTLPGLGSIAGGLAAYSSYKQKKRAKRKRREAVITAQTGAQRQENTLAAMEGRGAERMGGHYGTSTVFGVPVAPLSLYSQADPTLQSLDPKLQSSALLSRQLGVIEPEFYEQVGPRMAEAINATYPELGMASGVLGERLTTGMPESLRAQYVQNVRDAQTVRGIRGPSAAVTEGLGLAALQDQFLLQAIQQAAGLAQLRGSLTRMPSPYALYSQNLQGQYALQQQAEEQKFLRSQAPEWYEALLLGSAPNFAGGLGQGLGGLFTSGGTTTAASGGLASSLGALPAGALAFAV